MMDIVTVHGPCHVLRNIPGQVSKGPDKLKLSKFHWFQSEALKQANGQRNKFRKICDGRKEASFGLLKTKVGLNI